MRLLVVVETVVSRKMVGEGCLSQSVMIAHLCQNIAFTLSRFDNGCTCQADDQCLLLRCASTSLVCRLGDTDLVNLNIRMCHKAIIIEKLGSKFRLLIEQKPKAGLAIMDHMDS